MIPEDNNMRGEITVTKMLTRQGTSLSVNITKEARMLGLDWGDPVELVIRRANVDYEEDGDMEQEK